MQCLPFSPETQGGASLENQVTLPYPLDRQCRREEWMVCFAVCRRLLPSWLLRFLKMFRQQNRIRYIHNSQ